MDAELRVFVRLPEDADDMYMVTGDEEILFLYINNGDETIRCSTNITRMVDGVEKVKKTKSVSIRSYEAAFGDEEVNIVTKPADPVVNDATSSNADKVTTNPEESNTNTDQTVVPDQNQTNDAVQNNENKDNAAAPDQNVTDNQDQAQAPQGDAVTDQGGQDAEAPKADAQEPDAQEPEAGEDRGNAPAVK